VLVNVMVLTEGWDCQPAACVILLRPCSHKGTMMQMVGRVLRTVDPERYPGIRKDDAIVMDFGYTLLTHRDLEQIVDLARDDEPKSCPECDAVQPSGCRECPLCGFVWPALEAEAEAPGEGSGGSEEIELHDFVMSEIDLLAKSPFRWEDFYDGKVTVANGLSAWVAIVHFRGRWMAVGGGDGLFCRLIADNADRYLSVAAADDFLRENGDTANARKSKRWISAPPSDKQLQALGLGAMGAIGLSRYRASCAITWQKMERAIKHKLTSMPNLPMGARAA
jgi:DNA repair protein RadD